MSDLCLFQKYSQQENHLTNNTLLMFRYIYRYSPELFKQFLSGILEDEEISIGVSFQQQIKEKKGIPDGVISQSSFCLHIEAKTNDTLYIEQMQRHIDDLKDKEGYAQKILLGICKPMIDKYLREDIVNYAKGNGIQFCYLSYSELAEQLGILSQDSDRGLQEAIKDYVGFLYSQGMIINPYEMVAVLCGTSHDTNVKYGIYYEPAHRAAKDHVKYMGFYKDKTITHIGNISKSVVGRMENGAFKVSDSSDLTAEEAKRVEGAINASQSFYPSLGYGEEEHRYYLVGDLQEVNIKKGGKGGFMGHRYFDLSDIAKPVVLSGDNIQMIAEAVKGKVLGC